MIPELNVLQTVASIPKERNREPQKKIRGITYIGAGERAEKTNISRQYSIVVKNAGTRLKDLDLSPTLSLSSSVTLT